MQRIYLDCGRRLPSGLCSLTGQPTECNCKRYNPNIYVADERGCVGYCNNPCQGRLRCKHLEKSR